MKKLLSLLVLALLIPSVFANADLDLGEKAGQLQPGDALYFLDTLFDDFGLAFGGSFDARVRVAQERLAEGVLNDDSVAFNKGEELLDDANEEEQSRPSQISEEQYSELLVAKVIKRIKLNSTERNVTLPPQASLVASERVRQLAGRIVASERPARFDTFTRDCNGRGFTFHACSKTNNTEVCGRPLCLAEALPDIEVNATTFENVCNYLVNVSKVEANASGCTELHRVITDEIPAGVLQTCQRLGFIIDDSMVRNRLTACKPVLCTATSCPDFSACDVNGTTLGHGQFLCQDDTNQVIQCRFGQLIDTQRKCGFQSIFGGG